MDFQDFFLSATGKAPFPYQESFAQCEQLPGMLSVPTGLGKTAAVVMAWLWRRRYAREEIRRETPRRLVYCLPARILVEQTVDEIANWLGKLDLLGLPDVHDHDPSRIRLTTLMGGHIDNDWDNWPERDQILVGTEDQLLSRALNRGYAMSRFRWPIQFAQLNNDCLWIFDEVQLLGPGLITSLQLDAFRELQRTAIPVKSVWMSATIKPGAFTTVDREHPPGETAALTVEDRENDTVKMRVGALKPIEQSPVSLTGEAESRKEYARGLSRRLVSLHQQVADSISAAGGYRRPVTLAVLNTVARAQEVAGEVQQIISKSANPPQIITLHSRFRRNERQRLQKAIRERPVSGSAGQIIIATQAVEAGVDISAGALVTELAPWSSLVQRFGRCNRYGEWNGDHLARIEWIDLADEESPPYDPEDLSWSRAQLSALRDAGPASLMHITDTTPDPLFAVIRPKDWHELFDTTPDLAGGDIDVSRFIRDGDDADVSLFWRSWEGDGDPPPTLPEPAPDELCPAAIGTARKFLDPKAKSPKRGWIWDALAGRWRPLELNQLRPGLEILIASSSGGYDPMLGWLPASSNPVPPVPTAGSRPEQHGDRHGTAKGDMQTLAQHTDAVVHALIRLLDQLPVPDDARQSLLTAARWHDAGKAHPYFQKLLRGDDPVVGQGEATGANPTAAELIAKSDQQLKAKKRDKKGKRGRGTAAAPDPDQIARRFFRHELGSALAVLRHKRDPLAAYLAAAHHGKVRMSIRSLPDERPIIFGKRFARGIQDDDELLPGDLGGGECLPATQLDLSPMELGRAADGTPSWLEQTQALLKKYGSCQLAWLEALLRIADWRASAGKEA